MPGQKPKRILPPPGPTPPWLKEAKAFAAALLRRLFGVTQNWSRFRDILRNNYDLGRDHLRRGNFKDAILRLKFVLWLDPKHGDAWYHLGCAYLAQDQKPLARDALKHALRHEPEREEIAYMLAVAGGRNMNAMEMPKRIPPAMTREHFDRLAPTYARQQMEESQYRGHLLLCMAIREAVIHGRIDHVILDLGVGTGMCGPLLRDIAAHITGVDMSAGMLAEAMKLQDAQGKKIYDALIRRDLNDFLPELADGAFDIVLAAGVVNYIGDLHTLFSHAARVLKRGGIFALTADRLTDEREQEYRFDPDIAQFRYAGGYLQTLAHTNGLRDVRFQPAEVYPGYFVWLCVFGK